MTEPIDPRIVRVGIEINKQIQWYESRSGQQSLRFQITGTKFANPLQNECSVIVSGLNRSSRDYLLTETSPYNKNKTPKRIIVEAGRESTGYHRLYVGDIVTAKPGPPPDVQVQLDAKTQSTQAGNIISVPGKALQSLSSIADRVARDIGVGLDFQATNKQISNYTYSGPALGQVKKLQQAGDVRAFIDDDMLYVKDLRKGLAGKMRVLSMNSGMVGLPRATEKGIEVDFLIDGETALGGTLRLESKFNKPLNGDYTIDQLKFDIDTHGDPFFYTATCTRR